MEIGYRAYKNSFDELLGRIKTAIAVIQKKPVIYKVTWRDTEILFEDNYGMRIISNNFNIDPMNSGFIINISGIHFGQNVEIDAGEK